MKSSLTSEGPAPLLRAFVLAAITLYPIWFTIHYRAVYDPDIWWHMRAGEWVLQNRANATKSSIFTGVKNFH